MNIAEILNLALTNNQPIKQDRLTGACVSHLFIHAQIVLNRVYGLLEKKVFYSYSQMVIDISKKYLVQ